MSDEATADPAARYPVATIAIAVGLLALTVAREVAFGSPAVVLLRIGATEHSAVFEAGEVWRLLAAGFVHVGIVHLLFNGWALVQLGPLVEEIYGSSRFLVVYLLSVIGASLASSWFGGTISAGASGGIMGVLAFLVGASYLHAESIRKLLKALFGRQLILFWGLVTLGLGALPLPIDNRGHLGGVATGLLLAFFMRGIGPSNPVRVIAALLVAATAASLGAAIPRGGASARIQAAIESAAAAVEEHDARGAARALEAALALPGATPRRLVGRSVDRALVLVEAAIAAAASGDHASVPTREIVAIGEAAAGLDPPIGRAVLVQALLFAGDEDRARVELERVRANASPEQLGAVAILLDDQGRADLALLCLEQGLAASPDDALLENALAWVLLTARDPKLRNAGRALDLSRRAVASAPDQAAYVDTLAEAELQAGLGKDALAHEEHALQLATQADDTRLLHEIAPRLERLRKLVP